MLRPKHYASDVAGELVRGLQDGSILLVAPNEAEEEILLSLYHSEERYARMILVMVALLFLGDIGSICLTLKEPIDGSSKLLMHLMHRTMALELAVLFNIVVAMLILGITLLNLASTRRERWYALHRHADFKKTVKHTSVSVEPTSNQRSVTMKHD